MALFKTDDASDSITKALNDFLRDKNLSLSDQQYIRIKKLLMVSLSDADDFSYDEAYSQLCDIKEHRKDYEIDANAPNEAEEEMIRIIGAADIQEKRVTVEVETQKYKKRFYIALTLLGLAGCVLAFSSFNRYMDAQKMEALAMMQVINSDEENVIKDLVQKVVTMETNAGNEITHSKVYNEIKELNTVTAHGQASSYKKFNKAQFNAAAEYLQGRITP